MKVDPALYQFATVRQLEYLEAVEKAGSYRGAARALGVGLYAIQEGVARVKRKASLHGYSPEHNLVHPVAPGFVARGHSLLYKAGEPAPALTWVKTRIDDEAREKIIRESVAALMEDVPRAPATVPPAAVLDDLATLYTITDAHVGMRAWHRETGANWDLEIAERTLIGAFAHMAEASPHSHTGIVCQLGDYLHFDSLEAVTPMHKHQLDADSRYSKIVRVAVRVLRAIVDIALQRHQKVILVIAEGNHDLVGSVWLRQMFAMLYEREPRVGVIESELPYYVHQHGQTMLGWHHGHMRKGAQLAGIFAAQYPQVWGATKHRYIHVGHFHSTAETEPPGVFVLQHPTLAARDSYAARAGYISSRHATSITYHREHGEVARNRVHVDMIAAAA